MAIKAFPLCVGQTPTTVYLKNQCRFISTVDNLCMGVKYPTGGYYQSCLTSNVCLNISNAQCEFQALAELSCYPV